MISKALSHFGRVVFASNNAGKLRELEPFFTPFHIQLVPQAQLNIPPIDEPYNTFFKNALHKARHASLLSGLPALADDSGLCVESLEGAPGVHSARYASLMGGEHSAAANNAELVRALVGHANRRAYYVAVLVLIRHAQDLRPLVGEGKWYGEIIDTPRGNAGFGYDPLFYLPDLEKTVAELTPEEKNKISHRAQALRQLLTNLENDR